MDRFTAIARAKEAASFCREIYIVYKQSDGNWNLTPYFRQEFVNKVSFSEADRYVLPNGEVCSMS